ncbi:acyltransferase family protein [Arthrobacter sp. Hor0625]|uniref:acyltransferase family protein n=1 Tax=Arthrobacter sp. Hor0625 TaxID=3457358 RepID=UPI00403EDB90
MPKQPGTTRVTQLDGLRGLAALVVVACHVLSVVPGIGHVVFDERSRPLSSAEFWAVFSPLHLLWNGTPAVHVFFVLSGFVLILPFTKTGRGKGWASYYVKRLLRLYLPAWASLALAAALIALVPRTASPLQSSWADMYVVDSDWGRVARDGLLLLGASTVNTPLWTLRWEVLFSLLLPLYVLVALRWRRFWHLKLALVVGLSVVGAVQEVQWLIYLPIFAIGAILGVERDRIRELTGAWPRLVWLPLSAAGLLLANAEWLSPAKPVESVEALITVGATLIVLVFLRCGSAKKLGDTAAVQWLGRISFSLYLVHLPIILAAVTLLRPVSLPLALAVAVVLCFVAAELFYRYVEQPAQRLSTAAGRAVDRRVARRRGGGTAEPDTARPGAPRGGSTQVTATSSNAAPSNAGVAGAQQPAR